MRVCGKRDNDRSSYVRIAVKTGLLSLLITVGLNTKLLIPSKLVEKQDISQFASYFQSNLLTKDKSLLLLVYFATFFLIYFARKIAVPKKNKYLYYFFALCFSIWQILGTLLQDTIDTHRDTFYTLAVITAIGIKLISITLLSYYLSVLVIHSIQTSDFKSNRRFSQSRLFIVLLVICSFYLYIYFPGILQPDAAVQIGQYLGIEKGNVYSFTSWNGIKDYNITNHHPYLTTYLFGAFYSIGIWVGNIHIGILLYVLLQMFLFAATETAAISYFDRFKISPRIQRICSLYYIMFPPIAIWAIIIGKDPLFALLHIWLLLFLLEVVRTEGLVLTKARFCTGLAGVSMGYILTRGQGLYYICIILIVLLFVYRRYWKQVILSLLSVVLFCQIIVNGILMSALNVAPGGKQEALGVFFQQTARYVVFHEDEITAEEKQIIDNVLDYEHLAENYDPTLQDPVKYTYKQQATTDDLLSYFKVWVKGLVRHPVCYLKSVLYTVYPAFYIQKGSGFSFRDDNIAIQEIGEYQHVYSNNQPAAFLRRLVEYIVRISNSLPGISFIFSLALIFWVSFSLILILLNRRSKYIISFLPDICLMLTFFICPLMNFRYFLPLILGLPLKILMGIGVLKKKIDSIAVIDDC